ncbi:MAG TPA: hypothetical protein VGZ22_10615 [Isosphaeraceae bacterium]|nr:hypothetical protein [Isosphaeraceae bacterium]
MFKVSRQIGLLFMACLAACPAQRLKADEPRDSNPLESLSRFVGGAWVTRSDASESNDSHFRVRVIYEWGINHKLMKVKSFLTGEKGEQLVYESFFFWHPGNKKLEFYSISIDGSIFEGSTEARQNTYESVFDSISADKKSTFKQTLTFLDDDTLQWTVFSKKDGDWAKMIDAKEYRVRDGAAVKP